MNEFVKVETSCPGTFNATTNIVSSPRYPSNRPAFTNCLWLVTSLNETKAINITFNDFM
ncbi:hypothetical protein Ciccas_008478, partial [Cichlidogyrus casuarinus]